MQPRVWSTILTLLLSLLVYIPPAGAQTVIHDTFGAGDDFGDLGYYTSGSSIVFGYQALAEAFTVPASGPNQALHSVTLPFSHVSGANHYLFHVMTNNGNLPGAVLETFTLTTAPANGSGSTVTFNSALNPLLQAGQTYWIASLPGSSSSLGLWHDSFSLATNLPTDVGGGWRTFGGGTAKAMRVMTTDAGPTPSAVPEPGAIVLFLPALAFLALHSRRRGRG